GGLWSTGANITITIVANNTAPNCDAGGGSPIVDSGSNLTYPGTDTSCPGTNGDPKLGPLQDNGGPTFTRALEVGSAAIDAGDSSCSGSDQRGLLRPVGTACDIGAFEVQDNPPTDPGVPTRTVGSTPNNPGVVTGG